MNKETARAYINQLAGSRQSFLFLMDFELEDIRVWPSDAIPGNLLYQLGSNCNYSSYKKEQGPGTVPIQGFQPFSRDKYQEAFQKVQDEIAYGNSFLINLTAKSRIFSAYTLKELFFMSESPYKLFYDDSFVFFSPESFIKIEDGVISSFPMKGTIDASLPHARERLLNDPKERAEHNTIVDLIRNDMSRFAKNVRVERFRYVDTIHTPEKTLYQVSSEIRGDLASSYTVQLGDIIFSQLPAGSVSGAPKDKTLEIIRRVEEGPRGYYSGIAGYFDGLNLDSCVMIRFIENDNGTLYYRSGGGITFMSEAEMEYRELLQKIYVPVS